MARKRTGGHSPSQIASGKLGDFLVRDIADPLSCCSEIEPKTSKFGPGRPTKTQVENWRRGPAKHRALKDFHPLIGVNCE